MRSITLGLVLLACLATTGAAQKRRSSRSSGKGIPCGRSYIAANKVCHIDTPNQPRRDSAAVTNAVSPTASQALVSRVPVSDGGRLAPYVGSATGTTYFPVNGCDSAAAIPDSLRVYFASESAARLLRYSRVTRCF